jgi:hypothetical protein
MTVERKPAIGRRPHPADDIPDRPKPSPNVQPPSVPGPVPIEDRLIEQHNVRIRPSTKARLQRAVDKLRYETGDRSISIASLTDQALREFLDRNDC